MIGDSATELLEVAEGTISICKAFDMAKIDPDRACKVSDCIAAATQGSKHQTVDKINFLDLFEAWIEFDRCRHVGNCLRELIRHELRVPALEEDSCLFVPRSFVNLDKNSTPADR